MYYVRSIYYRASIGCPDAVPKGIIAINLEDQIDLTTPVSEIGPCLSSMGVFDDSCWRVGCTMEDVDLIIKHSEDPSVISSYCVSDQIIPDWQFELIKTREGLVVNEQQWSDYVLSEEEMLELDSQED